MTMAAFIPKGPSPWSVKHRFDHLEGVIGMSFNDLGELLDLDLINGPEVVFKHLLTVKLLYDKAPLDLRESKTGATQDVVEISQRESRALDGTTTFAVDMPSKHSLVGIFLV